MSKRKKYETREEIVKAIDTATALFKHRSELIDLHGRAADLAFSNSAKETKPDKIGFWIKEGQHERAQERKLIKKNKSAPKRLEALKNTLAAFDTEIMPFESSRAVVLQGHTI